MKELAPGLHLLDGRPAYAFNVYRIGDVLIDTATRHAARRILRQASGIGAVVLTHGHVDHQGSAHAICTALGTPLMCGAGDRDAVGSGDVRSLTPPHWSSAISARIWAGPGHEVGRVLSDGDEVAGFTVIETPGHSPGHLSFFRASDRVLVLGDVLFNLNPFTGVPGLRWPPDLYTVDPEQNRTSAKKLLPLEPSLVCFGHGKPVDGARFRAFVEGR
jgi:Zn-dependent hydrolases, including glyoxylases